MHPDPKEPNKEEEKKEEPEKKEETPTPAKVPHFVLEVQDGTLGTKTNFSKE